MREERLPIAEYPLAEKRRDIVRGKRGKGLDEITLEALLEDRVTIEDLRITAAALRQQAEIACGAGRGPLAANIERGAELVDVPQDTIMRIYELLRPGRAQSRDELLAAARELRDQYGAERMAAFVEEAASVYQRRGLFNKRF